MIRTSLRWLLAVLYFVAGWAHLRFAEPFLTITPGWVPAPEAVVWWTGVAEIVGAIGLAQPLNARLRRAAAIGLAVYAVCVFPANINHFAMDMARADGGAGLAYHVPRMFAQPLIVWLALWTGEVLDWPFPRRQHSD
ncbi:DoxX family protein [Erythrobacter litoralis]|uniref:DoxX family protein n=1 Tax=Erythrobacter litoralis (strain HTCC2594) TaxID=314225 RepID=Q2N8G5_ERYLH|nr:DoxX family protein [Erythrobacter litoralis]ABC64026.1 hypothetical protein ELI_09670 [Erythrobacter litoralis HTCC2594]